MTSLKAIIFDVDGTLAETERDGHRIAFNRSFNDLGLDWCWSEVFYGKLLQISGGKERIRYYIEQYQPDFQPSLGRDRFIVQCHQAKTEYYLELLKTGKMPLRPGVKRLITEAHDAGIRLAIATTSALPNAIALLEQTLNPDWFEVIAAGDIVPQKKPAPDIYYYVLEQMQLQPSDCLVFEDSAHGLEAAVKAGIKTIVTANNYTRQQDFSQASLVVDNLGERDRPCTVLSKQQLPIPYLDLAYLRLLHQNKK